MKKENLDLINRYQKEIALLSRTDGLLDWDRRTYMPKKGIEFRSEQLAYLSSLIHKKLTSKKLFNVVEEIKKEKLDDKTLAIVKKLEREIQKAKRLPKKFVEELSKATSIGFMKWQEAKQRSDFKIFEPYLKKIIQFKRQEAKYIGLPGHPYNSLLDEFEEGMTVEKLKPLFKSLKNSLIELLQKIKSSEVYKNQKEIKLDNLEEDNRKVCEKFLNLIDFSNDVFRMDLSEHPFTIGFSPEDVRITTNLSGGLIESLTSTMHESGHALYFLNYPAEDKFNVLYDSPSYGMQESQSKFWENFIGMGKSFQSYFSSTISDIIKPINFDEWYRQLNLIKNEKIRIKADEIHYCLHIILRFELEVGLIEGSIKVKDLPKLWNEKMKKYFDINITKDSEGVLQDVHWSTGAIGYFPSYAIGVIYATQLYGQLLNEISDIKEDLSNGDLKRIKTWLKENIHKFGARYSAEELMKKTCGEGLNPTIFIDYLNKKYKEIYKF